MLERFTVDTAELLQHQSHAIEIVTYMDKAQGVIVNVAIECNDCYVVIADNEEDD